MKPDISIVIPVKNGISGGLEKCLQGIFSQKTRYSFEVIAIDSGSTDGTVDVLKADKRIRLIQIAPSDFGHAKTRNLGARDSSGRFIVYLNSDAWPADDKWLDGLIDELASDDKIAGTYSRQLPKPGCHLYAERDMLRSMPDKKIVRDSIEQFDFMSFSTVSAAIRKDVWQKTPFDDAIEIAEDQDWARKILQQGMAIVLEPASRVFHSHNYNFMEMFRSKVRIAKAFRKMTGGPKRPFFGLIFAIGGIIIRISGDLVFILRYKGKGVPDKLKEILISICMRTASFSGRYYGGLLDQDK